MMRRRRNHVGRKGLREKQVLVPKAASHEAAQCVLVGLMAMITVNTRALGEERKERRKTKKDQGEEVEVKRVVDIGLEVVHLAVVPVVNVVMKGLKTNMCPRTNLGGSDQLSLLQKRRMNLRNCL
jgi:hypothetical protein